MIRITSLVVALLLTACAAASAQQRALPMCRHVEEWRPLLAPEDTLGLVAGVAIDPLGRVVAFRRAGRPFSPVGETPIERPAVLVLDPVTGAVLSSWGAGRFFVPHSVAFDREGNVWVADTGLHQVLSFSPEGELRLAVGRAREPGADERHFDQPSGVVVADDGSFYVSDGYGNARIMHFAADGRLLGQWGTEGGGRGQLAVPHGVVLGRDGLVYVADRGNARIQSFDRSGRSVRIWDDPELGRPYAMLETDLDSPWRGHWLVSSRSVPVDGRAWSRVNIVDPEGRIVGHFGEREGGPNVPLLGHGITLAQDGSVYLSGSQGLLKFECR